MDFRIVFTAFLMAGLFCNTSAKMNQKLLQKVLGEIQDLLKDDSAENNVENVRNIQEDKDSSIVDVNVDNERQTAEEPLTDRLVREYKLEGLRTDKKFGDGFMAFIHRFEDLFNGNSNEMAEATTEAPSQQETNANENPAETDKPSNAAPAQEEQKPASGNVAETDESANAASPQQEQKPQKEEAAKPSPNVESGNSATGRVLERASDNFAEMATDDDQETRKFKSELGSLLDTFMANRRAQRIESKNEMKPIVAARSQTPEARVDEVQGQTNARTNNVQTRDKEIDTVMNELDSLLDSIKARQASNQA